ncbi:MAG: hypothetical protein H7Y17_09145 [Chlorobia bacterium]|nr:hypothetical protein [Fimbriimonadaceae bacterium]
MVFTQCLLTLVVWQTAKPPLPPVVGTWVVEYWRKSIPRSPSVPKDYRLSVFADGTWKEQPPKKQGQWILKDGVLSLRIMQGEDLWTNVRKFLLGRDGKLALSESRIKLKRTSRSPGKPIP